MLTDGKSTKSFRILYCVALAIIIVGMPLSKFMMSAGQLVLSGVWICDIIYHQSVFGRHHPSALIRRLKRLSRNPMIWLWLLFYGYLVLTLLWSDNKAYGLNDLRIKAPLFVLPLILGTMPQLPRRLYQSLFYLFCGAIITSALWGLCHHLILSPEEDFEDGRVLSRFVSHIRLGLMMALACIWLIINIVESKSKQWRMIYIAGLGTILFFMIYAQLITGCATLLLAIFGILLRQVFRIEKRRMRIISLCLSALCLLLPAILLYQSYRPFLKAGEGMSFENEKYTALGTKYTHEPGNLLMENGDFVWSFLAMDEMRTAWEQRTGIGLDGTTTKGSLLLPTLVRYLTSKHLRKDAAGIAALSDDDIDAIKSGVANYRFVHPNLMTRIYQICWEVHVFCIGANPQANSVGQRLIYWQVGWLVFTTNPWYGTGCGDLADGYDAVYNKWFSFIDPPYRHRAHNQYLSMLIAGGIPGGLLFATIWLFAIFFGNRKDNLWLAFWIIAVASMLTEDTLETQAGVTFVLFFFSYLSFLSPVRNHLLQS